MDKENQDRNVYLLATCNIWVSKTEMLLSEPWKEIRSVKSWELKKMVHSTFQKQGVSMGQVPIRCPTEDKEMPLRTYRLCVTSWTTASIEPVEVNWKQSWEYGQAEGKWAGTFG